MRLIVSDQVYNELLGLLRIHRPEIDHIPYGHDLDLRGVTIAPRKRKQERRSAYAPMEEE